MHLPFFLPNFPRIITFFFNQVKNLYVILFHLILGKPHFWKTTPSSNFPIWDKNSCTETVPLFSMTSLSDQVLFSLILLFNYTASQQIKLWHTYTNYSKWNLNFGIDPNICITLFFKVFPISAAYILINYVIIWWATWIL